MTSEGSPLRRFDVALRHGSLNTIRMAALELREIRLEHATEMLVTISRRFPDVYERAALRWVHRLCAEPADLDLESLTLIVAALDVLDQPEAARPAMGRLAELCGRAGLAEVSRVFTHATTNG